MFDRRDIQLDIGDPIRWTANDRDRDFANNEKATLRARERDALIFRTADDRLIRLERNDPMLIRLDIAYASNAHAAQRDTADRALVVAQSTEGALINRSLVGMLFTRAREQVSFVVDSLPSVERRAMANAGEKTAASETAPPAEKAPRGKPVPERMREIENSRVQERGAEMDRDMDFGL